MKKIILVISLIMSLTLVMAVQENLMDLHQNSIILQNSNDYGVDISYELGTIDISTNNTRGGDFSQLSANDYSLTGDEGLPQLPYSQKIISVPLGASVEASVEVRSSTSLNLLTRGYNNKIIPAQASVAKCDNIEDMPFIINESVYNANKTFKYEPVTVKEIGILRGMRLFEVNFYPVEYNPVTGEIRVINSADVQVEFINGDIFATEELRAKTRSFMFEGIYAQNIFNYYPSRMSLENYPLGYVIITPNQFLDTLEPFITWKQEQGYDVTVGVTETIGSTTTAIKNFMQGLWDAATPANPAPSYLLIVGDTPQVPAFTGSTDSGHVTDLNYVRLSGTDYLPEMYYGRFSANNISELTPQVNKTLMYQKFEMSDPSYLERMTLIAGVDGYWAQTHGNGTLNYGVNNYFTEDNGIDLTAYYYPQSGNSAASIVADVSAGLGYINYTAHGSETSWADPSFTISNVNNLTNNEMYPVVVGNCCITNHFNTGTCFGEAWLRATNGAVIYIGGNNNTYWDEDYWWSVGHFTPTSTSNPTYAATGYGMFDALFHEHNEAFEDWAHTAGSMVFTGNMAVQASASTRKNYYWEIYSIMGDPSLMPYIGLPEAQNVNYSSTLLVGMSSLDVTAAPYSYAALSSSGQLLGAVLTDGSGNGTINFDPINTPGNVKLVVSHTDYQPFITEIEVVPAEGPYLVIDNQQVAGFVAAGQNISLSLGIGNVGVEAVSNVDVTFTNTDGNAIVSNGTSTIAYIDAESVVQIASAFVFEIADGINQGETIAFNLELASAEDTWEYEIILTAIGPRFSITNVAVNDGDNNLLDPNETAEIVISYINNGSFTALNTIANLVSTTPGITIVDSNIELNDVAVNQSGVFSVTVETSAYMETGTSAEFTTTFTSDANVSSTESFALSVGLLFEDFESGDFSSDFNWNTPGWTVVNSEAYEGTYSAKSNTISHNQSASMTVQMDDVNEGEISFWVKVSSESGYDLLKFSIDNAVQDTWSGTVNWQEVSYNVTAGNHTFKWEYEKDGSVSTGSDCAWIDYIVFPTATNEVGDPAIAVDITEHNFGSVTSGQGQFNISNEGQGILAGQISANPESVFSLSMNGSEPSYQLNYSIDPNQSVEITVYFNPTANIEYSSNIIITSNDPAHQQILVSVNGTGQGVSNVDDNLIPQITELQGNYPNPFNPETAIKYAVKENGPVNLKIYNLKGQLVKTLVNEQVNAGYHSVVWDGKDNFGTNVATGIYLYRLETKTYNQTKKMMLMK